MKKSRAITIVYSKRTKDGIKRMLRPCPYGMTWNGSATGKERPIIVGGYYCERCKFNLGIKNAEYVICAN